MALLFRIVFSLMCFTTPLMCMTHNGSAIFSTQQLFICAEKGNETNLIDICFEHGGDIFATDQRGRTPLAVALEKQNYWREQSESRFAGPHAKAASKKILHTYETTVKKLCSLEEKNEKRSTTKLHERRINMSIKSTYQRLPLSTQPQDEKFRILCACAVAAQQLILDKNRTTTHQEYRGSSTENKTHRVIRKYTFAAHAQQKQLITTPAQPISPSSSHSSLEQRRKKCLQVSIPPRDQIIHLPMLGVIPNSGKN